MGGIRLFCWVGHCILYFVPLAEEAMGGIRQRSELTRAVAVYPSTPKRGEHSRGGHHRPSQRVRCTADMKSALARSTSPYSSLPLQRCR